MNQRTAYALEKQRQPGRVLLFRSDTGYTAYFDDAAAVVAVLDGAAMSVNPSISAWFHWSWAEENLRQLFRAGLVVACCDHPLQSNFCC